MPTRRLRSVASLLVGTMTAACSGGDSTDSQPTVGPADASILSAYYGLDELPAGVALVCGAESVGQDGMPVTFSVQLDEDSVSPAVFSVETASGEAVTPCLLYTSPSPRDQRGSRMPSSA